ncbi:unnamed protein product [Tilletia caries]|uniref:Uncharacterized protein n=1 Tax=Tilletia caries TaxID=13290 RepID=A0ABN7J1C9_9BASI|nr:unnamed protein product [Tilletia caries]
MYWYRSHATQKWGNNTLNMPLKGYLLQRGGQEMDKHRFEALREDAKDKCHQYLAGLPDLPSQYKYKTFEYFHHSQQTEQGPGASDLDASSSRHDHQAGQEESGVTPARPDPTVTSTAVESDTAALNTTSTIPTATSSTEPTTAPQVISSDGNTEGTDANPIGGTSTATPTPTADITTTEGTVTPEALSTMVTPSSPLSIQP